MRKRIRSASVFAAIIAVFLGIALPFSGVFAARKSAATAPIVADAGASDADNSEAARLNEIAPSEPDAFYFIGYLNTQLQKYDPAIAAFQSALAVFPFHASAEFGLARAYQRKGETENARVHLQKFQKITLQHLGAPFGAGYGDQGKFSLAGYAKNG